MKYLPSSPNRRNRQGQFIKFNPPHSANVKSNVGKTNFR